MLWIYDLPTWLFGVMTISLSITLSLAGLFVTYRLVHKRSPAWNTLIDNEVVGSFLSQILTLYGITLGLIAVATWESAAQVSGYASQEAAVITTLYRDFNGYPPPERDDLRTRLRDYTRLIIEQEWPAQQRGQIVDDGTKLITDLQNQLMAFEPKTEGQKIVHSEAFAAFNRMVSSRRQRVEAVTRRHPGGALGRRPDRRGDLDHVFLLLPDPGHQSPCHHDQRAGRDHRPFGLPDRLDGPPLPRRS